jgi:hypothetical protein
MHYFAIDVSYAATAFASWASAGELDPLRRGAPPRRVTTGWFACGTLKRYSAPAAQADVAARPSPRPATA